MIVRILGKLYFVVSFDLKWGFLEGFGAGGWAKLECWAALEQIQGTTRISLRVGHYLAMCLVTGVV